MLCGGGSACQEGEHKVTEAGSYFWPMAMGHPNYYSLPPWQGPTDLQASFSWEWFGPTGTRYEDAFMAAVIDDKKNIYVNGNNHVYKLNEDGVLQWTYRMPSMTSGDAVIIYDGKVNGATVDGQMFSIDMESGTEKWVKQVTDSVGMQHCQLAAHKGVVVTKGGRSCGRNGCAQGKVFGLNSTDGAHLWTYEPGETLWDVFPQFPDDESVVVMDQSGAISRVRLQSGELIWKAGGLPGTWTDGSQFVASNDLTYSVAIDDHRCPPHVKDKVMECPGYVTAHKTSDGSKVFQVAVPKPPNCSPVVGPLGESGKLTLIMPIGQQTGSCEPPAGWIYNLLGSWGMPEFVKGTGFLTLHKLSNWLGKDYHWLLFGKRERTHDLYAFDAGTGQPLWVWTGPKDTYSMSPGDSDGFIPRSQAGIRNVACPTPWSQPRIGPDGTIYIGNENGYFYAIRDANHDDRIDDATEVSVYDLKATHGHQGSAHAPGMMVSTTFDGVHVWKF